MPYFAQRDCTLGRCLSFEPYYGHRKCFLCWMYCKIVCSMYLRTLPDQHNKAYLWCPDMLGVRYHGFTIIGYQISFSTKEYIFLLFHNMYSIQGNHTSVSKPLLLGLSRFKTFYHPSDNFECQYMVLLCT